MRAASPLLMAFAGLSIACSGGPSDAPPPPEQAVPIRAAGPATLTVRTDIAGAELVVDGRAEGPLTDGRPLELAPGEHVIAARRGGVVVARATPVTAAGVASETRLSERPGAGPEAAQTATSTAAPTEPPTAVSPEETRACMMAGDNRCVIRLLEGHDLTEPQHAALIEAYRATSQQPQAVEHMRTYVERYPDRPRARQYEQLVARFDERWQR